MKSRDFVYWLQGFFEISKADTLTAEQLTVVKNHLNLVFKHEIDPEGGDPEKQSVLNQVHTPGNPNLIMRC